MQGRGRGSYLGLLLESSMGKSMVGSGQIVNREVPLNDNGKEAHLGNHDDAEVPPQSTAVNEGESSNELDSSTKCAHSTWTSLDLLGNRGRRKKLSKDISREPDRVSPLQDIDPAIINVSPTKTPSPPPVYHIGSTIDKTTTTFPYPATAEVIGHTVSTVSPINLPSPKPKQPVPTDTSPFFLHTSKPPNLQLPTDSCSQELVAKQVHLSSPQEFMPAPITNDEKIEVASESSTDTSGSSLYIPPHKRKGYQEERPEVYELEIYERRKVDNKQPSWRKECYGSAITSETAVVESELNWQKWKLQRTFKKILSNLTTDNVLGVSKDISDIVVDSQLSAKFPGISEVNVIVELLVCRVLDKKECVEVAVHLCRLLNAMYPDEFPSSLREVVKELRRDIFAGVANKNTRCDNFCLFLGKMCDVGKVETRSFQDCLKQSVVGCLFEWISPFQRMDEDSAEAKTKVMYLCELLELTKNVMTIAKRSWVKSCFGKIKNCILSDKLLRDVKENLLDAVLYHLLQPVANKPISNNDKPLGEVADNDYRSPSRAEQNKVKGDSDLYKDVKKMLQHLELGNLLEKFQDNLIRDSLLRAEKNELKSTLQEAGFAPGAILEIQLYLEKKESSLNSTVADKPKSNETTQNPSLNSESRVKNLESDLQQLLAAREADQEKTKESEKQVLPKSSNVVKPVQLEKAKYELISMQVGLNKQIMSLPPFPSECRPPPGFLNFDTESRTECSTSVKQELNLGEWPTLGSVVDGKEVKREVTLERKNPEDTQEKVAEGLVPSKKSAVKNKGRGRGRRNSSGSLETSTNRFPVQGRPEQKEEKGGVLSSVPIGSDSDSSDTPRPFGSSMPIGCFICGSNKHRSAYCTNNKAMFD